LWIQFYVFRDCLLNCLYIKQTIIDDVGSTTVREAPIVFDQVPGFLLKSRYVGGTLSAFHLSIDAAETMEW
jgi:hypothetical protein